MSLVSGALVGGAIAGMILGPAMEMSYCDPAVCGLDFSEPEDDDVEDIPFSFESPVDIVLGRRRRPETNRNVTPTPDAQEQTAAQEPATQVGPGAASTGNPQPTGQVRIYGWVQTDNSLHFSIEVIAQTGVQHTHHIKIDAKGTKTKVETLSSPPPLKYEEMKRIQDKRIDLPATTPEQGQVLAQERMSAGDLGKWNKDFNSCARYVWEIASASGAVGLPEWAQMRSWMYERFKREVPASFR